MRRPAASSLACALLTALAAWQRPAAAEEDPDAVALYQEGVDLAKEGKYAEAIPKFEKAQEMGAPPVALYNIGKCYEALGKYDLAVSFYERYAGSPGVTDAAEVQKIVKTLEKKPSHVSIATEPPGAKVLEKVDEDSSLSHGVTPVEFSAEAGKHTYILVLEGYRKKEIEVEAGLGKPIDLTVELSAKIGGDGAGAGGGGGDGGGTEDGAHPLGISIEAGAGAVLHTYEHTGIQAGADASVEAGWRFSHGVDTGFSLGLRVDFRPYTMHGRDVVSWETVDVGALFTDILLTPGFQFRLHPRLGVEVTLPLGVAILAPIDRVARSMELDILGGYVHGGGLVLFDVGLGAALRVAIVKGLFLEIEPVRLHVLVPLTRWETGTKALCDIDMAVRLGWEV